MPLESKRRQTFTRIAATRIIFTRIGCTLLTCDMYMSDLRHIHDPVLSSLKMKGIRLLFSDTMYLQILFQLRVKTPMVLLTPWCRDLLEKLTGFQLVKKFPAF
jgi:hypothetical protein